MSMIEELRSTVVDNRTLFGFEYNGKDGNVDPDYAGYDTFLLFFSGNEKVVNGFDAVLTDPFWDGRTFCEIADEITITEQ